MAFLRKYLPFIAFGVLLVLALALLWPRRKQVLGALTSPLSAVQRLVSGGEDVAALKAAAHDTPQPEGSPMIIVPGAAPLDGAADVNQLRLQRWPDFYLNDGEVFIWSAYVPEGEQGATLFRRGVTHMNVALAFGKGFRLEKAQRFIIVYRNAVGDTPFTLSNLPTLKAKLDAAIAGQISDGVDIISLDFENDQQTTEYGQVVRELARHVRDTWKPRLLDYLGLALVGDDFNVVNNPIGSLYNNYLADVTNYDDSGVGYYTQDQLNTGAWAYSIAHVLERARRQYPSRAYIGYFWHWNQSKTQYLPEWVAEGCVLLQFMCGGAGLKNWEDGLPTYYLRTDEGLFNGYYRLSRVNRFRQGVVEHIIPEVSEDGGKSWHLNDAYSAKQAGRPLVRLTKNSAGYQVLIEAPTQKTGTTDLLVRAPGVNAFAARAYAEKNVFGVIPA